jgi:hypothetical protein
MDKNGVKMTILWAKLIQWQFCKYLKTSFSTARPISSSGTVARHGRHPELVGAQ